MATQSEDLVFGILRRLLEACKAGENGYRMAADHARDPRLKFLFQDFAEQRGRFAAELQGELGRLGTQDRKTGTLHPGWPGIKAAVMGGSDRVLLTECERAEDASRRLYREALQHDLPPDVHALVQRQCAAVHEAYDRIRLFETTTQ
jgi:uncharacterized protein (TIGR02284 family)